MPDYLKAAAAFRAKAASTTFPEEAKILIAKAEELERKYGNANSQPANDTTVINRDGRGSNEAWNPFARPPGYDERVGSYGFTQPGDPRVDPKTEAYWREYLENLVAKQWMWNSKYYDKDGNPVVTEDDIVEEDYRSDPEDEDYGYEEYQ